MSAFPPLLGIERTFVRQAENRRSRLPIIKALRVIAGAVMRQVDVDDLEAALERAGVEFVSDVGVKLREGGLRPEFGGYVILRTSALSG